MAKRLRLASRHSRSIGMADEEQPFLSHDLRAGRKGYPTSSSFRTWFRDRLPRKHGYCGLITMALAILAILAILFT